MWGFWRPRVRFLILDDEEVFIYRIMACVDGAGAIAETMAFIKANPRSVTYSIILDLRFFAGTFNDEDLIAISAVARQARARLGFPEVSPRPQIYLGRDRHATEPLANTMSAIGARATIIGATSVDEAWAAVAPGRPMPPLARRFLARG